MTINKSTSTELKSKDGLSNNVNNNVKKLNLEQKSLKKIDSINLGESLIEISLAFNKISKISGLGKLSSLTYLSLSHNNITSIEGLKSLINLIHLDLSYNNIKKLENLAGNTNIINLSLCHNEIFQISNVSYLIKLKELDLSHNRLKNLSSFSTHLPKSLTCLHLADNCIEDLTNVYHLSYLPSIKELSIGGNPCLIYKDTRILTHHRNFTYRPYVINWCPKLHTLDKKPVSDTETLKAEWLYSQGKARNFKIGEHANLINYLLHACPVPDDDIMPECPEESKLRKILNHQKRVKSQVPTSSHSTFLPQSSIYDNASAETSICAMMSNSMYDPSTSIPSWNTAAKSKLGRSSSALSIPGVEKEAERSIRSTAPDRNISLTRGNHPGNDTASNNKFPPSNNKTDQSLRKGGEKGASALHPSQPSKSNTSSCPSSSALLLRKNIKNIGTSNLNNKQHLKNSIVASKESHQLVMGDRGATMQSLLGRTKGVPPSGQVNNAFPKPNNFKGTPEDSFRRVAQVSSSKFLTTKIIPSQIPPAPSDLAVDESRNKILYDSATRIQAVWRGHATRTDPKVVQQLQCLRLKRIEDHIENINRHIITQNEVRERENEWRNSQMNMLQMMWTEIKNLASRMDHVGLVDNGTTHFDDRNHGDDGINQSPLQSPPTLDIIDLKTEPTTSKSNKIRGQTSSESKQSRDKHAPVESTNNTGQSVSPTLDPDKNPLPIEMPQEKEVATEEPQPTIEELEAKAKNFSALTSKEKSELFKSVTQTISALQENIKHCMNQPEQQSPLKNGDHPNFGMSTTFSAHDGGPLRKTTAPLAGVKQATPLHPRSRSVNNDSSYSRAPLTLGSGDILNNQEPAACPLVFPQVFRYLTKSTCEVDGLKSKAVEREGSNGGTPEVAEGEEDMEVKKITDDIVNSILLKAVNKYSDTKAHRSLSDRATKFLDLNLTDINLSRHNKIIPSYNSSLPKLPKEGE